MHPKAGHSGWRTEVGRPDIAIYAAVAATPTPRLDRFFRNLSRAADHSKLWTGSAAATAGGGAGEGRRAAVDGLASIAVTSAVVNRLVKPAARRRRPARRTTKIPLAGRVTMPRSTSFPSSHAASAFAFATGVWIESPGAGLALTTSAGGRSLTRPYGRRLPERRDSRIRARRGAAPSLACALDHLRATSAPPEGFDASGTRLICVLNPSHARTAGGRTQTRSGCRGRSPLRSRQRRRCPSCAGG